MKITIKSIPYGNCIGEVNGQELWFCNSLLHYFTLPDTHKMTFNLTPNKPKGKSVKVSRIYNGVSDDKVLVNDEPVYVDQRTFDRLFRIMVGQKFEEVFYVRQIQ